jgi:FxsC-like protein
MTATAASAAGQRRAASGSTVFTGSSSAFPRVRAARSGYAGASVGRSLFAGRSCGLFAGATVPVGGIEEAALGGAGARAPEAPVFFISYAHGPDDGHVRRLFEDLSAELRRHGMPAAGDEVGVLDSDVGTGEDWQQRLAEALASCKVFIPIYSPRYFTSQWCGREWEAFTTRRLRASEPAAVLPVQWVPMQDLPPPARDLRAPTVELGQAYAERGLYGLIRTRRFRDEYESFVTRLAGQVVDMARRHPLPPAAPVRLDEVPSAFTDDWRPTRPAAEAPKGGSFGERVAHFRRLAGLSQEGLGRLLGRSESWVSQVERGVLPVERLSLRNELAEALGVETPDLDTATDRPRAPAPAPTGAYGLRGSRHIHFFFAAPTLAQLPAERTATKFYGEYTADWRPFLPDYEDPLSLLVQTAAAARRFTSDLHHVDGQLGRRLDEARGHSQVAVLLVDPWALELGRYQDALAEFDRRNEPTTGVLVLWPAADEETRRAGDALSERLSATLPRNLVRPDPMFRVGLESADDFEVALAAVIAESQRRLALLGRGHHLAGPQ